MSRPTLKERRTRAFAKATEWLKDNIVTSYTDIYEKAGMPKNQFNSMRLRGAEVTDENLGILEKTFPGFTDMFNSMLNGTWKEGEVTNTQLLDEARMAYSRAAEIIADANRMADTTIYAQQDVISMLKAEVERLKEENAELRKKTR